MKRRIERGFTLIEVLIAIAITAVVMLSVSSTFITTLRAQREVQSLTESTEAGSRILSLIERDLRGLWIYNILNNKVLVGRNRDLSGPPADHIDFLTSTDSISTIPDTEERPAHSPVSEVGYWLKANRQDPLLMELWRREDPMVDDDLLQGGTFQLVHDRIRSFNITYYKTLGHSAEEFNDWDSSTEDALPRVIKIEFTIERKLASSNEVSHAEVEDFEDNNKKYTRYIVLEKDYMDILKPQVALIPVFPPAPKSLGEKGGAAGGGENGAGPMTPAGGSGITQQRRGGEGRGNGKGDGKGRGGDRGANAGRGKRTTTTSGFGGRGTLQLPPGFNFGKQGGGQINLNQLFGGGRK